MGRPSSSLVGLRHDLKRYDRQLAAWAATPHPAYSHGQVRRAMAEGLRLLAEAVAVKEAIREREGPWEQPGKETHAR